MTRPIRIVLLGFVICAASSCGRRGPVPFALKAGDRLVFFGDSITQDGLYVTYVEAYLLTRFPDRHFTLLNHGLNSETIAVTRAGGPRPPSALRRFARDVSSWKPSQVVACFGMNDGGYRPFDEERFRAYREAVGSLLDRTRNEAHAALVLLTPPPYDPYRRVVGDPLAREFGYGYPAIDYDETLEEYANHLVARRAVDVSIADAHAAMTGHLKLRRRGDVSFALTGDGIHPDPTGHWLLAQTLLLAWDAPAVVAETTVDAAALRTVSGDARSVARQGDDLVFTWRTRLPMPIDPSWDRRSLALERVSERLNRYRLSIVGLPSGRYRLLARFPTDFDEVAVGDFEGGELAAGLDLTALNRFPTVALAARVLQRLIRHRQAEDAEWRASIDGGANSPAGPKVAGEEDRVRASIRSMCEPPEMHLRVTPIDGK